MTLLPPGRRRRWLGLIALASAVGFLEVLAALLVLFLLGGLLNSRDVLVLPIVGDLRDQFPGTSDSTLETIVYAVIGLFFVVRATTYLVQSYLQNRMSSDAGALLARRLLRGYLAAPYAVHIRRNSAELIRNAHESVSFLAQQVFVPSIGVASESLLTFAVFATLLVARPLMTIVVVLVLGPVVLAVLRFVQPRLLVNGRIAHEMSEESVRALTESLEGFREIKVLGAGRRFEDTFSAIRLRLARAMAMRGVLIDVPRIAFETSLVLFVLVYVAIVTRTGPSEEGTIASLGLFAYAAMRVLPSLNRITNHLQHLRFSRAIMDALYEDVVVADDLAADADPARLIEALPFADRIELRDVSFRYEGSDRDALSDVNLVVHPGEFIGIVGPTGGGKSTLIDIIIGLLPPSTGCVMVDGVDVQADPRRWYAHIGMVPQNVFLLDDSLSNNIAFGVAPDEVDDTALADAVDVAQLARLVADLPQGLETRVGERGVRLSGGERQRVAIARALYRRPDVLIFDEGTSSLDTATETALVAALDELRSNHTVIAVAHRLSTVAHADRVVLVEQGQIVRIGPLDELFDAPLVDEPGDA